MSNKTPNNHLSNYFITIIKISLRTPSFFIIIILNFISSFLILLGIPLLIPALQYLQNSEQGSNLKYINIIETIFNTLKIDINFYSLILFSTILIFIGQMIVLFIELYSKNIHIYLIRKYMNEIIDKYYKSSWSWMMADKSGKFQSAISREITSASEIHLDSLRLITNFFQLIVYISSAFIISISGSIYSILFFIFALILNLIFSQHLKNASNNNNKANIKLLSLINSLILNKKFLKSSKNFDNFSTYIKNEISNVNATSWKLALLDGSLRTFTYLFGLSFMIVIFIFHKFLNITFNEILVLLLIFSRLVPTSSQALSNFNRVIERLPIYESINKRILELQLNKEQYGNIDPDLSKEIIFKNVEFHYNKDEEVLKNINLVIKPLKTTALIGESGSGKSTFLDVFMGLLKINKGNIFINDINFSDIDLDIFRKKIAYVSQETSLLDGTILFNFKIINNQVTEDKIYELCKKVKIYDFISKLPEKLNTNIGENGVRLSGGQKQRIALVRALLSEPKILILDEATSNLDIDTESSIMDTIKSLRNNLTILIVTHRFTFLNDVDSMYLLKEGKVNKIDNIEEMLKKNSLS